MTCYPIIIFATKAVIGRFLTSSVHPLVRSAPGGDVMRPDPAARLPAAPTPTTTSTTAPSSVRSSIDPTELLPAPATNSYQFEADLRTIGPHQPQQIYRYLRVGATDTPGY